MTPFRPDAARTSLALRHLADPECSFGQAALNLDTTLEALAAWMTLPNIRETLQQIEQAAVARARLISATLLPLATAAVQRLLSRPETILPADATPDQARRANETLRRAGNFLFRLTRLRGPGDAPVVQPVSRPAAVVQSVVEPGSLPAAKRPTHPSTPPPKTIKAFDDLGEGPATLSRYLSPTLTEAGP